MFIREPQAFASGIDVFRTSFTVRLVRSLHFGNTFANQGMRDDKLRPPIIALLCNLKRIEKLLHVLSVDFLHVEAICLETFAGVFALGFLRRRVERDGVAIVNEDQVIEPEMAGERARLRGNAFLETTVSRQTNDMLIENPVLGRVETRRRHLRRHRNSDGVAHPLSERASRAFHTGRFKELRVAGCLAVQLPEALDLVHGEVVPAQMQPGVKEHTAVTRRENEVVPSNPARFLRVMFERVAVQHCPHLRTSQRKTEVPRFRGLHCVHAQTARLIRGARKNFEI